jgi:hypothetical protein
MKINKFNAKMVGYTGKELQESSKQMIVEYKSSGKLPIENTTVNDYMIVFGLLVYTPYIPLYQTNNIKN